MTSILRILVPCLLLTLALSPPTSALPPEVGSMCVGTLSPGTTIATCEFACLPGDQLEIRLVGASFFGQAACGEVAVSCIGIGVCGARSSQTAISGGVGTCVATGAVLVECRVVGIV